MITGAMIVSKYGDAKPGKRVDLICKYYPCFLAVVENYIVKMKKDIIDEQDFNRRDRMGDLGIRVQTSNIGDPTQSLAALFNAPTTISGYYQAEVNHDMPELAMRQKNM